MMETNTIGCYGQAWMNFMETHHMKLVRQMKMQGNYEDVARSIDRSAWDYRHLLERQYAKMDPPPEDFSALQSWTYTRDFYIDSEVMREKVLVAVTRP